VSASTSKRTSEASSTVCVSESGDAELRVLLEASTSDASAVGSRRALRTAHERETSAAGEAGASAGMKAVCVCCWRRARARGKCTHTVRHTGASGDAKLYVQLEANTSEASAVPERQARELRVLLLLCCWSPAHERGKRCRRGRCASAGATAVLQEASTRGARAGQCEARTAGEAGARAGMPRAVCVLLLEATVRAREALPDWRGRRPRAGMLS
jgi:hypothetical protein